jgi:alpha-1,6-mannosyltransferase
MRIMQLANFYHATSGGLRTAIDALGAGYAAAGHEVILVVPGSARSMRTVGGRTVVTLRAPRVPASGGYRTIIDQRAVADLIRLARPDVIELSDRTTLARIVAALPERPPVVLFSHERLDLALARRTPDLLDASRVVDIWTRRLLRRVDVAVCASEFAASELDPLTRSPVRRIPLGVDLDTFRPARRDDPPLDFGWSGGAHPRAVFVGRLSPEKHARDAITAAERLVRSGRFTELLVVGDGPDRVELERLAAGLPVRFVGHVGGRDVVAAVLRRADVAISPSPHETFGLAALEAMASGTPVATVAEGGVAELVVPGAGAVAGGGVNGLAAAIASLLEGDRNEQRRVARAHAERYSWTATVEAMLELHADTAGRRARSVVRAG